jgi:hypothetical protein
MVFFSLWFFVCLIDVGKLFNVGKTVDQERMTCGERMSIQFIEGICGCVGVSKFDKGISMWARFDKVATQMRVGSPLALSSPVVPWHGNIIGSDRGAFSCKRFRDFFQKFLEL